MSIYSAIHSNLAIGGFDAVAYFTQNRPERGRADQALVWDNRTWRFAGAESRAAFEREPEAFVPQYGGHCAWALSQGYIGRPDPQAWRIVDGKLYLFYSEGVQRRWLRRVPDIIAKADANWPLVLKMPSVSPLIL